jgi:hypothetical protein
LVLFPTDTGQGAFSKSLNIDESKVYLNKEVVQKQIQNAYINVINTFLTKFEDEFWGKTYNLSDCPPGFEGPICRPCDFGTFKPFYGSRKCLKCPCLVDEDEADTNPHRPRTSTKDCYCMEQNLVKENFGVVISILFVIVGMSVFLIMEIFKKLKSLDSMILHESDLPDCLFTIEVLGKNTPSFPFKVFTKIDREFLKKNMFENSAITKRFHLDRMSYQDEDIFISKMNEFFESFEKEFAYNFFENFILKLSFLFNYGFAQESILYLLKSKKLSNLNKMLLQFSVDIASIDCQTIIKYCKSNSRNYIYLAVLGKSTKRVSFIMPEKKSLLSNLSELSFKKEEVQGSERRRRIDYEEDYPISFKLVGSYEFMNPLKMNFNDPRLRVFIQKSKRIILPNLSKCHNLSQSLPR